MDEIIVVPCSKCNTTVTGTVSNGKPVGFIWQDQKDAPQGRVAICDSCSGEKTKPSKKSKPSRSRRKRQ